MSFRRAVETTGISTLLFATAALIATGCSSGSGSSGSGGTSGSGGKTGTGGKIGIGGSNGTGGGTGGSAAMPTCTPAPVDPNMPVIYDFTDMTTINFGTAPNWTGTLAPFNQAAPMLINGTSVIDQAVTGYGDAGVTIDILSCNKADLSAFTGIAFDIAGVITPQTDGVDAGALPPQELFFQVGTAPDDVASNYDSQNNFMPSWGTCIPATGNQYDGTCASPSVTVNFAPGPTLVTKSYLWSQIGGGKVRGTPDPTQITRFSFIFPYNVGNVPTPFHINLTLDNIRLLTAGGTTTDGGTDTTTPPPVDAAPDTATD